MVNSLNAYLQEILSHKSVCQQEVRKGFMFFAADCQVLSMCMEWKREWVPYGCELGVVSFLLSMIPRCLLEASSTCYCQFAHHN